MVSPTALLLFSVTSMVVLYTEVSAVLPSQCNPGLVGDLPPRYRKVCTILSKIHELRSEMEGYLDEKASHFSVDDSDFPGFDDYLPPVRGNDVKRQDVDHVFLRFGRRR